ncbi:hypothetical protein DU504_04275 [Haloplanus salinus]|uniref:Aldehyde ferredoxin oxidoreductase C-terminal domain-containing protein n=1 Tax=Haloplanus salinus TaxID=1126245 RepID=A0A368NGU1_9EURY|nr:hypothetical protein DU504_04275 [Haloplanus salinus]
MGRLRRLRPRVLRRGPPLRRRLPAPRVRRRRRPRRTRAPDGTPGRVRRPTRGGVVPPRGRPGRRGGALPPRHEGPGVRGSLPPRAEGDEHRLRHVDAWRLPPRHPADAPVRRRTRRDDGGDAGVRRPHPAFHRPRRLAHPVSVRERGRLRQARHRPLSRRHQRGDGVGALDRRGGTHRRADLQPRTSDQRRTRRRAPRDGHALPSRDARTHPRRPAEGMYCPPEELSAMLDEYYAFRGWDDDGIPTPERLDALDMAELAD